MKKLIGLLLLTTLSLADTPPPVTILSLKAGSCSGFLKGSAGALACNSLSPSDIPLIFSSPLADTAGTVSIPAGSGVVNGYISSADWTTFNGKQSSGSYITALTSDVVASGPGSAAATIQPNVVSNTKLAQIPAHSYKGNNTGSTGNAADITSTQLTADLNLFSSSLQGLVPSSGGGTTNFLRADGTFAAPPSGSVTSVTATAPLVSSGGATPNLTCNVSSALQPGCLSSSSFTTFNAKQAAGNYITALTGDGTASGPGSAAFTLATVNGNVGSFGSSTAIPNITVNAKGLVTAAGTNAVIAPAGTLTGTTLASNVVTSSLTSVGTISSGVWNGTPVGIAFGGTNNSSAYTAGSVVFSNGTSLTQDNAKLYWDDSNAALGIGTIPSTSAVLDVVNNSGSTKVIQATGYGSNVGFRGRRANGTLGSPTQSISGDTLSFVSGRGYGATGFGATSTGAINFIANQNFTDTAMGTYINFQTTSNGSVTAVESMRIASGGVTLGPQSASTAIHQFNGGMNVTTRTVTTGFTVDNPTTDRLVFVNFSAPNTIVMPTPTNGRILTFIDISGNAQTNTITFAPHASEMLNGIASNYLFNANYGAINWASDGTNWWSF